MPESVDIVVGHDNVIFMDALAHVLSAHGHRVVAAVTTTRELLSEVQRHKPTLAILGDGFGGGLASVERLAGQGAGTRVVLIARDRHADALRAALDAGVFAYVHTSRGLEVLLQACDRVVAGEVVVESSFLKPSPATNAAYSTHQATSDLTAREVQCLLLLAEGLDTNAIASRLGVSTATVRTHVQGVLTKLGMHSRLEAASWALRSGLTDRHWATRGEEPA